MMLAGLSGHLLKLDHGRTDMAYHSTIAYLTGLCFSLAAALCAFTASASSIGYQGFYSAYADPFGPPIFTPAVEMRLAAALRDDTPMPATDPTLNERLRSIDIRTALEDHRRLHWDLG